MSNAIKIASLHTCNGFNEPQIVVGFPKDTSTRVIKAELHTLAAAVEMASEGEGWLVHFAQGFTSGRVYIETVGNSAEEVARAMTVLKGTL